MPITAMLQYIIILLDDKSVSFCHYDNSMAERTPIGIETLKNAVVWAMKQNLNVQFVYSDNELPEKFARVISSVDHINIMPSDFNADVTVLEEWTNDHFLLPENADTILVIKASFKGLYEHRKGISNILRKVKRLNIEIKNVEEFRDEDSTEYSTFLDDLSQTIVEEFLKGRAPQLNLLTDRLMLERMNNCDAGVRSITLAPNGKFYICPAFYYENPQDDVGDLTTGPNILNKQLLQLDHAPLCRMCDAFQCKRCVWMNRRLTLDVNTPSHQQCVVAHLERNATRRLQKKMIEKGIVLEDAGEIPELEYLDPFNKYCKWK